MLKIGDVVKIVKNNFDPKWDLLIGKVGVITGFLDNGDFEIEFYYDEEWNQFRFGASLDEVEKIEKVEDI